MTFGAGDHPSSEQLDAFVRGVLPAQDSAVVEEHLGNCPECERAASEFSNEDSLIELLRRGGASDAPDGSDAIEEASTGYEVLEVVGRGGMGVVHRARQRALGRVVALKRIRLELRGDPQELTRFQTEAESAARLRHPGIVAVHDIGWRDGAPYIAMEWVDGGTLEERLRRGPTPPREAAELLVLIARAVHHAHAAGIVHRDLKPGNILLTADGAPKVGDFGLAKRLDLADGPTRTGSLLGTPRYMAPEQADGKPVGPPADVYALGVILYECLTGRTPFQAATPMETLDQVRTCEPPPPSRLQPGLARELQTVCLKCLEKDPARRYATAADLADDLERFLQGLPTSARPVGFMVRLLKWAKRRPSQASLAGLIAVVALGAIAALLAHQARLQVEVDRANTAAKAADQQRRLADANYREARAALQRVLGLVDDVRFAKFPRLGEFRAAQVEAALTFYDQVLSAAESPDPVVRLDTAIAAREAANLQIGLNRVDQAEVNLQRAIRLLDGLAAARPDDETLLRERLTAWVKRGVMLQGRDNSRSQECLTRAIAFAERLNVLESGSIRSQADLSWCEHNLGTTLYLAGRLDEAEPHARRAVELRRKEVGAAPDDLGAKVMLASSLVNLGLIHSGAHPDRAEASYAEAAGLIEAIPETERERFGTAYTLAELLTNWANLASQRGEAPLALARLKRGLELIEPIRTAEPNMERPRRVALQLHGTRANLLGALGRHADSVADWDRVVEFNDDPTQSLAYRLLRLFALARGGDHRRAAADLDALATGLDQGKPLAGADYYNMACLDALIAEAVERDQALSDPQRKDLANASARRAFAWLRRCAGSGFLDEPTNRDHAWVDEDLASIRSRPEFATVVPPPSKSTVR